MFCTKTYTLLLTIAAVSILAPIHASTEGKKQQEAPPKGTFKQALTLTIANDFQGKDEEKKALFAQFQRNNKTITLQTKDQKIIIPKDILNKVAGDLRIVLALGEGKSKQIKIPTTHWLKLINGIFRQQNIHVTASSIINFNTKKVLTDTRRILENRLDKGTYRIQVSTYRFTNSQKFLLALLIISILGGLYYFLTPQEDKNEDDNAQRTPRRKEVSVSA